MTKLSRQLCILYVWVWQGFKKSGRLSTEEDTKREENLRGQKMVEEMEKGYGEITTVSKITKAGINTINLSISAFPPTPHLLLPISLLASSAANFTALSNYSALTTSADYSTLLASDPSMRHLHPHSILSSFSSFLSHLPLLTGRRFQRVTELTPKWLLRRRKVTSVREGSHRNVQTCKDKEWHVES